MKDRILVSGYYGFGNAGDEAILGSIVQHLGKAGDLVILSASPARTAMEHPVRAVGRMDLVAISREMSQAALFVSGGGGLLQDATGLKSVPYYAGLLRLAQWRGVPTMLLGAGVGPIGSVISRGIAGMAVRKCRHCAIRDEASAALLRDLGVSADRISVTADPVLVLDPAPPERVDQILAQTGLDLGLGPAIAVAIRPWPTWYERQFKAFSAVLAQLAARVGAQIVLIPFQRPHDDRITYELQDCMQIRPGDHAPPVTTLREPLTPAELMGVLSRMDLVVGMRLHALIMAAAGGVPFVGVAYDPKVEHFASTWGMPVVPGIEALEDTRKVENLVIQSWEDRAIRAKSIRDRLPQQRERALSNFSAAREAAGLKGDLQWV